MGGKTAVIIHRSGKTIDEEELRVGYLTAVTHLLNEVPIHASPKE
jgi:hypothetical protein